MRSCVTELKYISCNKKPGEMKWSQAAQVLLSGSPVTVLMKGRLLTPNLTPVECASGGRYGLISWVVDIPQRLSS